MTHEMTAEEFVNSVNGYDEIAVKKRFGKKPIPLGEEDKFDFVRALIFVAERRKGLTDDAAYEACMAATYAEAGNYFADDDEPVPHDPVTDQGKDSQAPSGTPTPSPPSVS